MALYDPLDRNDASWFPANSETARLVAALLACRDVVRLLDGLQKENPIDDHHGLLLLATPVISLADNTVALHASSGRQDTSRWPSTDRDNLREWGRSLRRRANGPLRRLRNTLSAHHDPDSFGARAVSVPEVGPLVMEAIPEALCILILLLKHEDLFAWSRHPVGEREDIVQMHGANPFAAPTFRVENGQVVELLKLTLTSDPKEEAREQVQQALDAYNYTAQRAQLPQVGLTEWVAG